jgi:sigma-B regulation protein RsbU (phosphoserine phosphatase)
MAETNESSMFVTFFCGVLDLEAGHLHYCNAGHNPPMILTDAIRMLPVEPNLPLGIVKGSDFVEQETDFKYDDALFLYTDGLSEAENVFQEQFGEARIKKVLHGKKHSEEHMKNIEQQVTLFVGEAPQSDDLTMLFIHYLGKANKTTHHLTLHSDVEQIALLPEFVEAVAGEAQLDHEAIFNLNLALEEAVSNVIMYAYPDGKDGVVDIEAIVDGKRVSFVVTDSGTPFDPTSKEHIDINAKMDERPIGGLGIHLVRTIMDTVNYERKGENNILIMTKNYEQHGSKHLA